MNLRKKRKELQGLVGAIGLVAGLGGIIGGFYALSTAIFWMFAIWIVGSTLVIVLTDPPGKG